MDLTTIDGISELYKTEFPAQLDKWTAWKSNHLALVNEVKSADAKELSSPELQLKLWEDEAISGTGMCSIPMGDFAENPASVQEIVTFALTDLPADKSQRLLFLEKCYQSIYDRVDAAKSRMPKLKILRLMAALFPDDMTCLVSVGRLKTTLKGLEIPIPSKSSPVKLNRLLLDRIEEAIGPPSGSMEDAVYRSLFAWHLYEQVSGSGDKEEGLDFLPNETRLKGLTAMSGYVDTAISVVEFAQDGVAPDELIDFYQQQSPGLKLTSVKMQLSLIRHSLGLLKLDNGVLTPTELGEELLDARDPGVLVERLLTRVLGFDLILYDLSKNETMMKSEIYANLREHYPNWTTDRAPSSMLAWSKALGLIEIDDNQQVRLTTTGQEWAEWIPERPTPVHPEVIGPGGKFVPPTLDAIVNSIQSTGFVFDDRLIAQFHTALHMHDAKHFVILSGLSGTGKTQLAKLYADAYHQISAGEINEYFLLVPVQPDWMDATGLIGYVNPLQQEMTYETTSFLQFLHQALKRPDRPHFVCLDEMNLARVEYYFAPFLSAMEMRSPIVIHQQDEPIDTVEKELDWPSNLFIVGTVNMDETTHAFSDKVLDRAFTLEFWDVQLDKYLDSFAKRHPEVDQALAGQSFQVIRKLHDILRLVDLHFGYRVIDEALLFIAKATSDAGNFLGPNDALDCAVQMKILPKLRGEDTPVMRACFVSLIECLTELHLTGSTAKCVAMNETLKATGATRYWR